MKSFNCDRCHTTVSKENVKRIAMELPSGVMAPTGYNLSYDYSNLQVFDLCEDCFAEFKNFMHMNEESEND